MDEQDFFRAIAATPDDMVPRLVYADWLDERGDDRGEYVRLQVELQATPDDDERRPALLNRATELRRVFDPYWAARLDPPVWCVVGNVADRLQEPQDRPSYRGTRLFRANAKILLATIRHRYAVLDPQRFDWESVEVAGQHRQSRTWIGTWIRVRNTGRWRVRLIYEPGAILRLREARWPGFSLRFGDFQCEPDQRDSPEAVRRLFDAMDEACGRDC